MNRTGLVHEHPHRNEPWPRPSNRSGDSQSATVQTRHFRNAMGTVNAVHRRLRVGINRGSGAGGVARRFLSRRSAVKLLFPLLLLLAGFAEKWCQDSDAEQLLIEPLPGLAQRAGE